VGAYLHTVDNPTAWVLGLGPAPQGYGRGPEPEINEAEAQSAVCPQIRASRVTQSTRCRYRRLQEVLNASRAPAVNFEICSPRENRRNAGHRLAPHPLDNEKHPHAVLVLPSSCPQRAGPLRSRCDQPQQAGTRVLEVAARGGRKNGWRPPLIK